MSGTFNARSNHLKFRERAFDGIEGWNMALPLIPTNCLVIPLETTSAVLLFREFVTSAEVIG